MTLLKVASESQYGTTASGDVNDCSKRWLLTLQMSLLFSDRLPSHTADDRLFHAVGP